MIYFQPEENQEITSRKALELTLTAVADGRIGVCGHKKGDSLDGVVLPLSGPPDGSLKQGDIFPFRGKGKAEVVQIDNQVIDGHVWYYVRIYDP